MLSARIKVSGWFIALATLIIAALLWWLYHAHPLSLLLAAAFYVLSIAIPGRIILKRVLPDLDALRAWVFGSVLAEIVLGVLLKLTDSSLLAGIVLPVAATALWYTRDRNSNPFPYELHRTHVAFICVSVLAFLGLFLYGQAYDNGSQYHLSYNPTVDLSYFQTVLTSISNYGSSRDLAQLGYHFNYPDLGYQIFSFLHRLSGAEAFDLLFFFAPFKDFLLLSLALYCLIEARTERKWMAAVAAIGFYLFNSRSLLELNVPITNPAYREGLYILFFLLYAYHQSSEKRRWMLIAISMIGLVLVKPAIWLVAAPALVAAQFFTSVRQKRYRDLLRLLGSLAISGTIFFILFSPSQSGLSSGHYTIIFGEGLGNTIHALARLNDAITGWKEIVIRPLAEVTFGSILLGLLLFVAFLLQQLQHAGRSIALLLGLRGSSPGLLGSQLLCLILVCFSILAFVGMEYTSFLHVYLTPLLLTATTILLAITYRKGRSKLVLSTQVLLIGIDIAFAGWGYLNEHSRMPVAKLPSILIEEMRQVRELTDTSSVLATYETGLFQPQDERSYLAAAFTERTILSEGTIYGSLIMGYHENLRNVTASPVRDTLLARRATRDSIYFSADQNTVLQSCRGYGITHILIRHGQGERITSPVGDTIFHGRMLTLMKL